MLAAQPGGDIRGEAFGGVLDAVPEVVGEEDQVGVAVRRAAGQGDVHLHVGEAVADLAHQAVVSGDDEGADQGDVRHQPDGDQVRMCVQAQPVRSGGRGDEPAPALVPVDGRLRRLQDTSADSGHHDDKMLE